MAENSHLRRVISGSAALVLVLGAVTAAEEKTDQPPRRTTATTEWPSLKGVLAVDEVRAQLNLNEEEQEEIGIFVRGRRSRYRDEDGPELPPLPPDPAPWQVELRRQERRLRRILGDERYVRIRQLQAQAGGLPAAFTRDDPGSQLAVTPEQRTQARQAIRTAAEKMGDRFRSVPRDKFDELARVRTEMYDALEPELTGLMTDEQKEKWAAMTGEPAEASLILRIRSLGGRQ